MATTPSRTPRIRTGLFEIDLACPELRKEGLRIPLQEQPFRVLRLLLERPGDVVTREELQTRLWPADTYVGFDEGINTAIRKLRLAFGDSADNPRFIETLPRRGYRFIAPVSEPASLPDSDTKAIGPQPDTGSAESSNNGSASPPEQVFRSFWKIGIAAAVLALSIAAGSYLLRRNAPPNTSRPQRIMLAVLPFENLSNDPSQEYFSDGLTEETITDLGQLSPQQLGVIARTSAMAYKHTDKTVSQIGRELGVDYILEGSVRREGGRVRVSAQLIRVSDQTHLWAENYDRELHDLLDFENDLGKAIASQVQANLSPQRENALARGRTVDPEAYDLYLKGRYYWNQRTPAGIKQSIGYFNEATTKDENFALAYAGLADAYNISNILGLYSAKESLPLAREAAMKAIALDPSLAEAHAALGMEKSHYEFDFPGAEKEFLKALELNPNSAYAHLFYSNCYLMPMAREAQAIAENQKALALDPLSLPINNFMAVTYGFAGDYDKSYRQFQHTIELDPTFPLAHEYFAARLTMTGKYEQAIEENQKAELLSGASPEKAAEEAASKLKAFRSGGEKAFWQRDLETRLRVYEQDRKAVPASELASAYARAGYADQAFEWLDKAYDERDGQDITLLKYDFSFRNLHGDPRYAAFQK
ncbi:MAG: winged helix-turn-helix domain-containing tetratricopeptide repeat protein, partial [Candidatus Sulfotelmatobacter sp.]